MAAPPYRPDIYFGTSDTLPEYDHDAAFRHTEPPNPGWTYGQTVDETEAGRKWLEGEKAGWKFVDPATEDPRALYKLFLSGIVPRPIALVSTISEDGTENLAPFSYFNLVCSVPPIIYISSGVVTRVKDTVANIRATKNFTASIISLPWLENANVTCVDTPVGVDEWPMSGLTKAPSTYVRAPRVKESAFCMECELYQATDIINPATGELSVTFILGQVKAIHIRNDVLNARGTLDAGRLQPVARLGDISYARLGDAFRLNRPSWEEDGETIQAALKARASK